MEHEHFATATYVTYSLERTLSSEPDAVWEVVRDFGNVGWIPGATKAVSYDGGPGVGLSRILHNRDQGPIRETLIALSEADRTITYTVSRNIPFPVNYYCATMRVGEDGGKAHVTWSCVYEPEDATPEQAAAAIEALYNLMLDWIDDFAA